MKLQQLKYFIAVAESGSLGEASRSLYLSQSSLSAAIKELENELGIVAFNRSNRGLTLTAQGMEALSYARQVVAHAQNMERRFKGDPGSAHTEERLVISSQHYPFVSEVVAELLESLADSAYRVQVHESPTSEVIEDVRHLRSEVGVLYFDKYNEKAIKRSLSDSGLSFSLLATSPVYACVRKGHPLAAKHHVSLHDLEQFPRMTFEQGADSSFFFYEEPFSDAPSKQNVVVSDRGTMLYFLRNTDGYSLCSSASKNEGAQGIVFVSVETDDVMTLGYVVRQDRTLSPIAQQFLDALNRYFGRE